ncbi:MAG: hypothetical protein ABIA67_04710 [Candidatus Margulisiibacteriota bacterium]
MKNSDNKDIKENIKWFKKFSLEKRFEIAGKDSKSIEILRNLSIKGYARPKRAT